MGRSYANQSPYYSPFYGWQAQLVDFIDTTHHKTPKPWSSGAALIKLLPHLEQRRVSYGNHQNIGLDVVVRIYDDKKIAFFRGLEPETWLVIDGELNRRNSIIKGDPWPDLDSSCYLKRFDIDPSNGTKAPLIAHLYTNNSTEFNQTLTLAKMVVGQQAH